MDLPIAGCYQAKYVVRYKDRYYGTMGDTDELGVQIELELTDFAEKQREVILPGFMYNQQVQIGLREHCGSEVKTFLGEINTGFGSKFGIS